MLENLSKYFLCGMFHEPLIEKYTSEDEFCSCPFLYFPAWVLMYLNENPNFVMYMKTIQVYPLYNGLFQNEKELRNHETLFVSRVVSAPDEKRLPNH